MLACGRGHPGDRILVMADVPGHEFTRSQLERVLGEAVGKRLREIDTAGVLSGKAGNKGVPGAVVEQSVLGYPADNKARPDLLVDGTEVELKTTGVLHAPKNEGGFKAKEPVSVTAVRPGAIVDEEFETSRFWHKCAHLLFVYYLYADRNATPKRPETYAEFTIEGYQFVDVAGEDRKAVEHDWTVVRDFVRRLHEEYGQDAPEHYGRISSDLNRYQLGVLDTAPKYPNPPRFRLKRRFVDTFVQRCFGQRLEQLPEDFATFAEFDAQCHELTQRYRGWTIGRLMDHFAVPLGRGISKQTTERIAIRMFGGVSGSMKDIELFQRFSINPKTITLTATGARTEDMKLDSIDFDELQDPDTDFDDSAFRACFSETQLLAIMFEEPDRGAPRSEHVFQGFKRYMFPDEFIQTDVRRVWDRMRWLIETHELRIVPRRLKDGSLKRSTKTGEVAEAPNWPKSADGDVFVRGTGGDSSPKYKSVVVNGLHMYPQNLWIRGAYLAEQLQHLPFL